MQGTAALFGESPKPRIAIMRSDGVAQAKAAFDSPAYKAAEKVGDKYADFRVDIVEGLPQ